MFHWTHQLPAIGSTPLLLFLSLHLQFSTGSHLADLLQHHTTEQLEKLLQKSYPEVRLGSRFNERFNDPNNIITHSCHSLTVSTTTPSLSSATTSEITTTEQSFLEVEESSGPLDDLDCDCQPYSCTCRKQCFCRLSADPFSGIHYPPNANCPQCPSCDNHNDDDDDGNGDTKGMSKPDYKCSCSFGGIGGAGISNGGFMNCDCRVADCSCSKQCACTSKKSASSTQGFKEVEHIVQKPVAVTPVDVKEESKGQRSKLLLGGQGRGM